MKNRFRFLALALLLCLCMLPLPALAQQGEEVPSWEDLPENQDQHHYLLLCLDQWNARSSRQGNADGIVLVTLDTRAHRVMLTSVVRDALVTGPDGVTNKINRMVSLFSAEGMCRTLSRHLGVRVENYLLFDFQQIADLVDLMGGVDVTLDAAEIDYLNRYPLPQDTVNRPLKDPGVYHLNGYAAVIYMRIRKAGGGGDLMRTQRARNVLSSLADVCRSFSYEQAQRLMNGVLDHNTDTNMNLETMTMAMEQAYSLRDCTVEELRIPPEGVGTPTEEGGSVYKDVDWPACRAVFADFLQNSLLTAEETE